MANTGKQVFNCLVVLFLVLLMVVFAGAMYGGTFIFIDNIKEFQEKRLPSVIGVTPTFGFRVSQTSYTLDITPHVSALPRVPMENITATGKPLYLFITLHQPTPHPQINRSTIVFLEDPHGVTCGSCNLIIEPNPTSIAQMSLSTTWVLETSASRRV